MVASSLMNTTRQTFQKAYRLERRCDIPASKPTTSVLVPLSKLFGTSIGIEWTRLARANDVGDLTVMRTQYLLP
jgi:hypothetical protein